PPTQHNTTYTTLFLSTLALAAYINDKKNDINFVTESCRKRYTAANPPTGWPLPPVVLELLAQRGICLPAEFTYLNFGKIRSKGLDRKSTRLNSSHLVI